MPVFPTKILVASDGSDTGRQAIAYAGELAAATRSDLHLVFVGLVSRWTAPDNLSPAQYKRMKDQSQKRLDDEAAWARKNGVEVAKTHLQMGRIDAEIIRLSEKLEAGLVVVGSRGMDAIERILLGNDSESIVRHAHCPVLVVR